MIVEVIPEKRTGLDIETFSYQVPKELESQIKVGSIVDVPWGAKTTRGVVLGSQKPSSSRRTQSQNKSFKIKNIITTDPDFTIPESYLRIIKWLSRYYLCSLGEALSLFMPPTQVKSRKLKVESAGSTIKRIIKLNDDQERVFQSLKPQLASDKKKPALIHGVTGSGKTEVYLKLIEETLELGKQAVVLVPEIMLTPQTLSRTEEVFPDQVVLMHSGLSKSERYKSYQQFYSGEKRIILGPRSALLVPNPKLGLIIIDEEHDGSYKQEKNPKYSAITLAEKMAKENNALLVLGSATPSIESYEKTRSSEYQLLELKNRYQNLLLPTARVVDMRQEIKSGNYSPISETLRENIERVLKQKRHIFLFLNRRGTATFVSCRECGEVILCPNCSIPLIYHINEYHHSLSCHHCEYKCSVPERCPKCGGVKIKFFGAGVERIEMEIKALFPKAKTKKIESSDLGSKGSYEDFYRELKEGKIDILIGTQVIAKGLDIPTVDLVGIISADVGLHMPHYRANEKVFQVLTQVSGRSGRKDQAGQTIIQTYWPESGAIGASVSHDYSLFFESEIPDRKALGYPPFTHLIRVVSEERRQEKAKEVIEALADDLKSAGITFIGPAPCFFQKLRNQFRYHLIIKTEELPCENVSKIYKKHPYLFWDVDPDNLL